MLQHFHCGLGNVRVKMIAKSIRPEHHLRTSLVEDFTPAKPFTKSLAGKFWDGALLRDSSQELGNPGDTRRLSKKVGQPRHPRCDARPAMNEPHGIGGARPHAACIMMTKKF